MQRLKGYRGSKGADIKGCIGLKGAEVQGVQRSIDAES